MSWTDERVSLLKKLWGEGKTAAEIAKELGGVTRNAVIGKAHRLKLSNRASPIQPSKKTAKPKLKKVEKQMPAPANVNVAPKKQVLAADKDRVRVPLTDLGVRQCRWPIGDPQHEDFGFCGDTSVIGIPYCLEHAQVAYQAATRNRILKAEEDQVRSALAMAAPQKSKKATG